VDIHDRRLPACIKNPSNPVYPVSAFSSNMENPFLKRKSPKELCRQDEQDYEDKEMKKRFFPACRRPAGKLLTALRADFLALL
jgi:hypothetical protein